VDIARCANYDREHGVPDALDANNPIQAADLRHMHDQELLRCAHYDQDNGPPDDLYIILAAYASSVLTMNFRQPRVLVIHWFRL
jgi:hypothetical protein